MGWTAPIVANARIFRTLRLTRRDVAFGVVVLTLTVMTARVWWTSAIVPGMDYPQFLVFVRALQDHNDPSSPFHGTYTIGPWFMPTSLPINLVSALSYLLGHSIERAGKVLMTAQNVGLIAASLYLLRVLGRPPWAVLFLFAIIHSMWTVVGGFAAYSTSFPILVLGWALMVRWFERLDVRSGVALALCLCVALLWHGIGFVGIGLAFAVLWLLWRAPSWRARALGVVPTIPSLLQCAAWLSTTFERAAKQVLPWWQPFGEQADLIFDHVGASVPHYQARVIALGVLVGAGLVACRRTVGASGPAARIWRVDNPFLVLSLTYLAAYFLFPMHMARVEGIASRFTYPALLAYMFAWNLPEKPVPRVIVLAAVGAFAVWSLEDIAARFRGFAQETRGASALIDELGPRETLYYFSNQGASDNFGGPANKPTRELQQYATIRHGGLPNSSFAGYGVNYVGYVDGRNPMPGFGGGPSWSREMTKFDYVLTREGQGLSDRQHFRLVDKRAGWELYGVCGSPKFPACP
jgi:hypothetical protein